MVENSSSITPNNGYRVDAKDLASVNQLTDAETYQLVIQLVADGFSFKIGDFPPLSRGEDGVVLGDVQKPQINAAIRKSIVDALGIDWKTIRAVLTQLQSFKTTGLCTGEEIDLAKFMKSLKDEGYFKTGAKKDEIMLVALGKMGRLTDDGYLRTPQGQKIKTMFTDEGLKAEEKTELQKRIAQITRQFLEGTSIPTYESINITATIKRGFLSANVQCLKKKYIDMGGQTLDLAKITADPETEKKETVVKKPEHNLDAMQRFIALRTQNGIISADIMKDEVIIWEEAQKMGIKRKLFDLIDSGKVSGKGSGKITIEELQAFQRSLELYAEVVYDGDQAAALDEYNSTTFFEEKEIQAIKDSSPAVIKSFNITANSTVGDIMGQIKDPTIKSAMDVYFKDLKLKSTDKIGTYVTRVGYRLASIAYISRKTEAVQKKILGISGKLPPFDGDLKEGDILAYLKGKNTTVLKKSGDEEIPPDKPKPKDMYAQSSIQAELDKFNSGDTAVSIVSITALIAGHNRKYPDDLLEMVQSGGKYIIQKKAK